MCLKKTQNIEMTLTGNHKESKKYFKNVISRNLFME